MNKLNYYTDDEIILLIIEQKTLSYTCCTKSQLSTGHLCINSTPEVITDCAPHVVVADLHTALCGSASLESDASLSACCNDKQ